MNNVGYLSASRTKESDCMYTPYYAVEPLIKYIPKNKIIWTPFDMEYSAFVQLLRANGNIVFSSHIDNGLDFFTYEPFMYDMIISNPPFSLKDKVLKRLYELGKPFAMLLPLNSLQGVSRYEYLKNGIQILAFDQRIGFHNDNSMINTVEGSPFASVYFCKDILPRDLILEHLEKYDRPLKLNNMIQDVNINMITILN